MGVGKGLAPSSFIQTPNAGSGCLRMCLSNGASQGLRSTCVPGWSVSTEGLELEWTFPDGSQCPCHIPGHPGCPCREHSQLRARLVTNISVSP